MLQLGVLGAGVIGLTTALELQKEFPDSNVTILSEKFNQLTTSSVAAGIFRPGTSFSTSSEEETRMIISDSYKYYESLRLQHPMEKTGVSEISGYIFSSTSPFIVKNDLIEKILPSYRPATDDELQICPGTWKYGAFFTTLLTECTRFLPWCLTNFQEGNGQVQTKRINHFREVEKYDVVVNCLGLGAKEVCKDRKIVPIRGQVLKVKAKWLKNFFYADYDTYIIPGQDFVTLGGCRNYDSYDETISRYDTEAIWERCTNLVPKLRNCKVEEVNIGLRPHRDPVRLERDIVNVDGKQLKIVHNYGHGGYGVTTAPGCAKQAAFLVKESLRATSKL